MHQSPPTQLARTIQTKEDRLAEQVDRIRTVFAERALDPDMAEIPGGKTGLIVRDFKGKDAVTPVYNVAQAIRSILYSQYSQRF